MSATTTETLTVKDRIFGKLEELESVTVLVAITLLGLFLTIHTLIITGNAQMIIEVTATLGAIISAILAILKVREAQSSAPPQ